MKLKTGALLLTALAVTVGCGGGSGGGGGTTGVPAGTTFATLTPIKDYTYDLSGNATVNGIGKTIQAGQRQVTLQTSTQPNAPFLLSTDDSVHFTDNTNAGFTFRDYVSQDGSANILLQAVDFGTGIQVVDTPDTVIPGTFAVGTDIQKTLSYGSGSISYRFTIGNLETVRDTDNKAYQTYKVTVAIDYGSGYQRAGSYWYSPSLGTYVKAVETVTRPDRTESVTAVLASIATP